MVSHARLGTPRPAGVSLRRRSLQKKRKSSPDSKVVVIKKRPKTDASIAALKKEYAETRAENAALKEEVAKLRSDMAAQIASHGTLISTISSQMATYSSIVANLQAAAGGTHSSIRRGMSTTMTPMNPVRGFASTSTGTAVSTVAATLTPFMDV